MLSTFSNMLRKTWLVAFFSITMSFQAAANINDYTFTFKGRLTQVIDNNNKLAGTGIVVGAPFTGYFTYDTAAAPWFVPPWAGNFTYEWVKAYRFTVHTAQGNYTFGYIDSSRAFYQVDIRNYHKLWWGQAYITNVVTNFPANGGNYSVGFNLSNTAGTLWDSAAVPNILRASDFDFTEVSFSAYQTPSEHDYRIVGTLDPEPIVPTSHVPGLSYNYMLGLILLFAAIGAAALYFRQRRKISVHGN